MKKLLATTALMISMQAAQAWEALPEKAPAPADNPVTTAKVELGKTLYFDPRLSVNGTQSCNSCHNVMAGGDDNRAFSQGATGKLGGRSAPTVWNAAFQSVQFWDGRAESLEAQAAGPITNPVEMGMPSAKAAEDRLKQIPGYKALFKQAFGTEEITMDLITKAIASYERTLITPNSPYDRFVKGDKQALTAEQQAGMKLFEAVGCASCHSGANFSGPTMAPGQGFYMSFPVFKDNAYVEKYDLMKDKGREEATGKPEDAHKYRVPTLRNIALTAPYFHNGSVKNLDEAVRVMAKTQLNKDLTEEQVQKISAFLEGLTGEFPEQTLPRLPGTHGTTLLAP